jgi:AcrR family transcriptional regulator
MGTRIYRGVARKAAAERTREAIVAATRKLLVRGTPAFSVDDVAEEAGVARMTVYHRFGSKRGLLEALFDDLAARGLVEKLRPSVVAADPSQALDLLIDAFAHFWHVERPIIRRLRALMATDADFEASINARDQRRRELLRGIVRRMGIAGRRARDAVDTLHMLTSFESFDALSRDGRTPRDVTKSIRKLARAALS